jgi:DNA-binding HxlR family transcriptional regulator
MSGEHRSGCPINLSLEVLGDRWSLIILRDMIFGGRRHFRELLNGSLEGIASNILADRMKHLVALGMLTAAPDPTHKQKVIYSLTEQAIELVPILAQISAWGMRYFPVPDDYAAKARLLAAGGPALWEAFMDELRETHLGAKARRHPRPDGPTIAEQLEAAHVASREHESVAGPLR